MRKIVPIYKKIKTMDLWHIDEDMLEEMEEDEGIPYESYWLDEAETRVFMAMLSCMNMIQPVTDTTIMRIANTCYRGGDYDDTILTRTQVRYIENELSELLICDLKTIPKEIVMEDGDIVTRVEYGENNLIYSRTFNNGEDWFYDIYDCLLFESIEYMPMCIGTKTIDVQLNDNQQKLINRYRYMFNPEFKQTEERKLS